MTIKNLGKSWFWLRHLYYWFYALVYLCLRIRFGRLGYFEYKWLRIQFAISDSKLLNFIKSKKQLPKSFGKNIDERIVEYPWLLSHIPHKPGTLLDIGSTLNFWDILKHPKIVNKKITIVGLAPEYQSFPELGVKYVYTDARNLPFPDKTFDFVTCISTLEHIGFDNSEYINSNLYKERRPRDYLNALLEFRRVLKIGGILYLTVPFGKSFQTTSFQLFTSSMIKTITKVFKPFSVIETYFRYQNCWQVTTQADCNKCIYHLQDKPDLESKAVSAEAVACISLIKH